MNKTGKILDDLRRDIKRYDKPENKINAQQFFKEKLAQPIVLKTPVMRKIAKTHFKHLKDLSKKEIFGLCDLLLESNQPAEKSIGFEWIVLCHREYEPGDFKRFEDWLKKHVNGWGSCDNMSCNIIGVLLFKHPELIKRTVGWRKSKNRWLRRASAVSLIPSLEKKTQLKTAFEIADTLLLDEDDMVQKGYGWMLKVASNSYPDDVFNYVMRNRRVMPRTALRYAIEKYPPNKRKKAMTKD